MDTILPFKLEVKHSSLMANDLMKALGLDLCSESASENESSGSPMDSFDDDVDEVNLEKSDESDADEPAPDGPAADADEPAPDEPAADADDPASDDPTADANDPAPDATHGEGVDSNGMLIFELESKLEAGVSFGSLEQAHGFYCEYARQKGFSVRRGDQRYIGRSEDIRWKDFVCHCAGEPYGGVEQNTVRGFRKQVKRTKCTAKIRVYPVLPGVWKNTLFLKDHNHPLLAPDQSYLLRSSRVLSESRLGVLQAMNSVGIPTNIACGFMEVQSGGPQNVGYIRKDAYNKLWRSKKEKRVLNADSIALLEFFNAKTNSDPFFFWRARYDNDRRLVDVFFRDTRCLSDYEYFGDVLLVDTTYKTNRYGLSCAPFVGFNHHSTSIMFGVGFLSEETSETFEWLLGVFLESMNGKHPKVVFSDQCRALMNGIDRIFPSSTHRLCQWHINNNAVKHFGPLNGNEEFKKMWYRCMNWVETEEEFENLWSEMMSTHVQADNTWLPEMYTLRHRWASVFSQNVFKAGMVSTSRSEGTNKVLKAMIRSCSSLHEFACAYENVQTRWRDIERAEDAACLWLPGQFVKKNDMLTHAATVYTRKIYKKFEHQCTEAWNVVVDWKNAVDVGDGNVKFKATRAKYPNSRARTVTFNLESKSAHCSCYMWEGQGILCRHILKVYQFMDVQLIPDEFILKRWMKNAKEFAFSDQASSIRCHNNNITKYLDFTNLLMRSQYEMILASKDSDRAQEYLLRMMENTKEGFKSQLGDGPSAGAGPSVSQGEQFQFLNPNKVKQKGPAVGEKKGKKPFYIKITSISCLRRLRNDASNLEFCPFRCNLYETGRMDCTMVNF